MFPPKDVFVSDFFVGWAFLDFKMSITLFAGQVQEMEGQICTHLEKIGSNLAKRHVQLPSPATDVRKRTSTNETPDNSLVLVTGIAAAAAMTVLGLAILNKK